MAIQLGSAYGKVSIDSSGVKSGVDGANKSLGSLEQKAKQLGATLQSIGKIMTTSFTLPILAAGAASIKYASDLEETRNKVKVVFGDMSEDVLEWGENSALAFGQSKQQALEAAGTFGNLFTSMGLGKDASADMSKGLVELAADLASFNNLDPAIVLEKLRSGLVGEVEPLRTLGINLSMAQVQAKAFEMGLADSSGQLSQAALLQARYALILEQSTNAQGDFARTSDGLANQTRILNAQWRDALATLGQHLLPIALQVVQWLNKMLESFNNLSPGVQKSILIVLALVAVIGPLLFALGAILPVLGRVAGGFSPFSGGIFGLIGTLIKLIATAATVVKVLEFMGIATGPVGAAILGLNGAIAGIGISIASVVLPILLIIATLGFLYWAFKNNFMGITDTAKQLWFLIKFYFGEGWKWLGNAVKGGAAMVMNYFKNMLTQVINYFRNINWGEIGMNMLRGLANGILGGIPAIIAAAAQAGQAALEAMRKALDSHSPSRKFMKLGIDSGDGYKMGLRNSVDPNVIAKSMAKPVQQMTTQQSTRYQINMANGLTLRDLDEMMNRKIDKFTMRLNNALGGA